MQIIRSANFIFNNQQRKNKLAIRAAFPMLCDAIRSLLQLRLKHAAAVYQRVWLRNT
jgi:hypothetical protein